jgi:hypothetical protein
MSNVTRIDWTVADGNVWTDDSGDYDMEASLDSLAEQILEALKAAYPRASVTVTRENVSGAFRELRAYSDTEDGWVGDADLEDIRAVADGVWAADDWYVKAS